MTIIIYQVKWQKELSMRVSQSEKAVSRARIVASAARLVRQNGVESTSVNDVMKDAKLTHGGFYRHFASKEALLEVALDKSFEEIFAIIDAELSGERSAADVLDKYRNFYLSDDHAASPGMGCPVPATAADVARGSPELKARFGKGINSVVDRLSSGQAGSGPEKRAQAIRQFAMMAGAITIARASDPETARSVLVACRERS